MKIALLLHGNKTSQVTKVSPYANPHVLSTLVCKTMLNWKKISEASLASADCLGCVPGLRRMCWRMCTSSKP